MMGRQKGRVCLIHQVDIEDGDVLHYSAVSSKEKVGGTVESLDEFYTAIERLLELYKTDRLDIALKFIKYKGLTGVCAKSFPMSLLSMQLIGMLNLCMGGETGVQLVHLPFSGSLYEQPNIFIEAYYLYVDEHSKFTRFVRSRNETHG